MRMISEQEKRARRAKARKAAPRASARAIREALGKASPELIELVRKAVKS